MSRGYIHGSSNRIPCSTINKHISETVKHFQGWAKETIFLFVGLEKTRILNKNSEISDFWFTGS